MLLRRKLAILPTCLKIYNCEWSFMFEKMNMFENKFSDNINNHTLSLFLCSQTAEMHDKWPLRVQMSAPT
jgi:hypothetical protein